MGDLILLLAQLRRVVQQILHLLCSPRPCAVDDEGMVAHDIAEGVMVKKKQNDWNASVLK